MPSIACPQCTQVLQWVLAKTQDGTVLQCCRCPKCHRLYDIELVELKDVTAISERD